MDVHGPDAFPAFPQHQQIDGGKIYKGQRHRFWRNSQAEGIGGMEQGQGDGPQHLEDQVAKEQPQPQGHAAYRQVFQKEQSGHLAGLQADENIGAQLSAASCEHEGGDVVNQPPCDGDDQDAGHNDENGQAFHEGGQGEQLLGEDQSVESVDQGGGQDDSDEID